MATTKYWWISALLGVLLVVGCNSQSNPPATTNIAPDSTASPNTVQLSPDSIARSMDTLAQSSLDTPRKSLADLEADSKIQDRLRQNQNPNPRPPANANPSIENRMPMPECKRLFTEIGSGWSHDSKTGLYHLREDAANPLRQELSTQRHCLLGLNQSEIEKLFGKPSKIVGTAMLYYLDKSCLGRGGIESEACECLKVELAEAKVAKKVSIVKNPSNE